MYIKVFKQDYFNQQPPESERSFNLESGSGVSKNPPRKDRVEQPSIEDDLSNATSSSPGSAIPIVTTPSGSVKPETPNVTFEYSTTTVFERVTKQVSAPLAKEVVSQLRQKLGLSPNVYLADAVTYVAQTRWHNHNDQLKRFSFVNGHEVYDFWNSNNQMFGLDGAIPVSEHFDADFRIKYYDSYTDYSKDINASVVYYVDYLRNSKTKEEFPIDVRYSMNIMDNSKESSEYTGAGDGKNNRFFRVTNQLAGLSLGVSMGRTPGVVAGAGGTVTPGNTVSSNPVDQPILKFPTTTHVGDSVIVVGSQLPSGLAEALFGASGDKYLVTDVIEVLNNSTGLPISIGVPVSASDIQIRVDVDYSTTSSAPKLEGKVMTKVTNVSTNGGLNSSPISKTTYYVRTLGSTIWEPMSSSKYRELKAAGMISNEVKERKTK